MEILSENLKKYPVMNSKGELVGKLKRVIISPENGRILAIELVKRSEPFLSPIDIRQWTKEGIVLGKNYEFQSADELVRLHQLLKGGQADLIGRKVTSQSGHDYGKVTSYTICPKHLELKSINAQKSFFGFHLDEGKLILRHNIIEIKPKVIIIRDSWYKATDSEANSAELDMQKSPSFCHSIPDIDKVK